MGASLQTFQPSLLVLTFQLEQVRKTFSKKGTSSPGTSIESFYHEMQQQSRVNLVWCFLTFRVKYLPVAGSLFALSI